VVTLSGEERRALEATSRSYTLPYYQVVRAQMVLLAADGMANDEIARRLNTSREVVSKWRKRFVQERAAGLDERPRPGRPRKVPRARPTKGAGGPGGTGHGHAPSAKPRRAASA